jgi:poly-gamma-glutamate system protein
LLSNKNTLTKKTIGICLAVILLALIKANFWRLYPPDPDCVKAVSIYSALLPENEIVGLDYSSLTTTLGNFAAKKVSENPVTAALMVRLLKDSGVSSDTVIAINASGSFPGFVLASLSACNALQLKTFVIASVGASTYGANTPGNTIADMLLKDTVRKLNHTLLAVTPGGSGDRGRELDPDELERISKMLEKQGIPFVKPLNLADAISLRESLFNGAGCTLLVNIGGNHASIGEDVNLALAAGIIKPDGKKEFEEPGLVQSFLAQGKPVIQILNVKKLFASYGLDFDENGKLIGNTEKLIRFQRIDKR